MKGLKPGTILSAGGFYFVVDSTDKKGGSYIKQTGARSVKEYKEMQQREKKFEVKSKKKKGEYDE